MTDSSNISIFSPLDASKPQIRLIHFEPRHDNDEITFTLHLADLEDDSCHYEALSYEWGDASNILFYIILNGQKFSVRENLWSALLYLRMKETARIIWIDALCINQENDGERNHQMSGTLWNIEAEFGQVSQMGKLYQRADRVIAWVGREEQDLSPGAYPKDAAEAVAFMECLKEGAHRIHEEHYHLGPAKNKESGCLSPDYALVEPLAKWLEVVQWRPLAVFCSRTYWSRLWIIQELVLAPEIHVQCGDIQLEWTVLEQAFASYALLQDYLISHPNGYIEVEHPRQTIGATIPFKI